MRWVTFRPPDAPSAGPVAGAPGPDRIGVVVGDTVHAMAPGPSLLDLLGDEGETLAAVGDRVRRQPADVLPLADVRLLAPIPRPPTVRDFYAFEEHVRTARRSRGLDMEPDWYELPVFYFSNPYAVTGPGDDVAVPPGCTELDYELEVAAVVGRGGRDLDPATAERHIAGYVIMNDWSARDLQRREMKLGMGPVKGKDFATSLGPFLVTPDDLEPARGDRSFDLTMTASVNGRELSRASLAELYWSFSEMLAYASRGASVAPGDVIGSGTCGTGCILELSLVHGSEAFPWLVPGDEVTLAVDRLGSLTNQVVAGPPLRPLRRAREA